MALRGIRGATVASDNTKEAILSATTDLLSQLIEQNTLAIEDIVTIFFSLTQDLDAEFPAVSARQMGLVDTPLLCLCEISVPQSLKRCIRILIQCNSDKAQKDMIPVYLKEAQTLRPDTCPQP